MATEKQIQERWGATHEISQQRQLSDTIDLTILKRNESVAMCDDKDYYWLLTQKVVKNNLAQADVSGSLATGYCFNNEFGHEVTVIAIADGWCMVKEFGKNKPYVLEEQYILGIKKESDSHRANDR